MFERTVPAVAVVFVAFALIFVGAAIRDFLLAQHRRMPPRNTGPRPRSIVLGAAIGPFVRHAHLV